MLIAKEHNAVSVKSQNLKLGLVIPFYEGTFFFEKLYSSIQEAVAQIEHEAEVEVLIVDNSNEDHTAFFRAYENGLIYLRTKKRIGFGRACNIGYTFFLKNAFDFVQFINQDGYLDKFCLRNLLNAMKEKEGVIAASSLPLTYETKQIESFFVKYYMCDTPEFITDLFHRLELPEGGYEVEKIIGACFMFRLKSTYQEATLFDEKMFMYFEDEDLCKRLSNLGSKIVLVPKALFFHQHSHTTDHQNKTEINKEKSISERYMRIKHSKNKLLAAYVMLVDDFFDGCKQLFRGRVRGFFNMFITDSRVLVKFSKKKEI